MRHHYKSKKIKTTRPARPIYGDPIAGDGKDAGRYYRCKHCGFICDSQRVGIGDGDGHILGDFGYQDLDPSYDPSRSRLLGLQGHAVLMENGSDGTPKPIRRDVYVAGGTGCPLCHSLNSR